MRYMKKELTLNDWEELVRNRPKPDTPGFYKLIRFQTHCKEYEKHEVESINFSNDEKFTGWQWRFPMKWANEQEFEYYPTFEEAYEAMMNPPQIDGAVIGLYTPGNAVGYRILHLGYGPHGTRDFYIDYRQYDADRREYMRSSCSSYHWNTPGIYGKFLGRLPEEIPFKEGDIVEITASRYEDGGKSYAILGVVIGEPHTVEEIWRGYRKEANALLQKGESLDLLFEEPDQEGTDGDEYFVLYGPFDESMRYATFESPEYLRVPSHPVPDEAREYLMEQYKRYLQDLEKGDQAVL